MALHRTPSDPAVARRVKEAVAGLTETAAWVAGRKVESMGWNLIYIYIHIYIYIDIYIYI